jgi:putative tryptophan/tyrosine transport system substrate-binding protein
MIGRRDFIVGLGGAAAWGAAARAQQPDRVRRIGIFTNFAADDPDTSHTIAAFVQELQRLGWTEGRNARFDYRWAGNDADRYPAYASELVALAPDVILASGGSITGALLAKTRTVPIVFAGTVDPVGGGFVASLARPGGNATGFAGIEYRVSAKWLEMLKQIAPPVTRVAVIRNATIAGGGQLGAIQTAAPSFRVDLRPIDARDAGAIERGLAALAREPNGGLIVTGGAAALSYRDLIVMLAARHRLPAVYPGRLFVTGGGLISYGPDSSDQYRRAAGYADRILRGAKPADLPVQAPVKYEMLINLKTAKALGFAIPNTLLATADEVIE